MDLHDFLAHLREVAKHRPFFLVDGSIRRHASFSELCYECPLTAVFNNKFNREASLYEFRNTGRYLGILPDDRTRIANAADNCDADKALRQKLLEACGLK